MENQALERAKAAYGTGAYDDATIEFLFPCLKENKDEMIRKELINLLSIMADGIVENYTTIPLRDFIAYLEKQKEQKWYPSEGEMGALYKLCYISNQITKEDDTELIRLYQDLKREYFDGRPFENMFISENQKGQKPKFKVGDKIHLIDGTSPRYEDDCITISEIGTVNYIGEFKEGYVPIKDQDKWELVKEQNPSEWSEEDKKLLDFWLDVIDRNDWRMDENFCKASREFINRLKSLRPQPNQEWSEKDEDMLNAAIEMVENSNTIFCFEVNNHKVSNWLKSLRHQPKQEWSERDEAFLESIEDAISSYHDLNHAPQYHYWLEEKLNLHPQQKQ